MGGASMAALALGGPALQAQVVSGSTHTVVNTAGNATTVTTNNVNAASKTGFNRFSQFGVNQPDVVTLVLPNGTQNLVNVVGGDIRIDGAVFSRLASASGDIGGNLFFITSGGFAIGESGSVNTGRLIVRGKDASGNLLDTDALYGQATAFSTSGLLDYAPVSFATINGRVNARGGIDIKGTNVTVGAGAALSTGAAGVAGVQALVPSAVVSTAGLVEGAALVKVNGGIAIVGADSVTVAAASNGKNAALLDARPSEDPAMAGGIDIASSGQITLAGTLTAWDGTATGLAGDIKVAASKTVTIDNSFENMALGNYFLTSTAKTGVDVGGTITGGRVSITADASASTASDFNALKTTVQFLENYGAAKLLGTIGSALDVFYTRSDAQTTINVGAAASLLAKGDLTVKASSISNAEGAAEAEAEGTNALSLSVAAGVAQVASSAVVTVDGKLRAGGALSVAASNRATSELEVQAVSTEQAKAAGVAYTDATATAAVTIGAAAKLDGSSVALSATNIQEGDDAFKTVAKTISKDGSAGGGAAAVTNLDLSATLTMAGTIGSIVVPGTVTLDSKTVTNQVINSSGASTGSGVVTDAKSTLAAFQGDRDGLMQTLLGTAADKFGELVFGSEKDEEEPDPDRKSKRFGAAVSVLFNDQAASTLVTGNITSSGQTSVDSLVQDKTVRNNAKASVAAEQSKDGKATSIAGAAAWSTATYASNAIVGGTVTSGGLAVNATTDRPRGGEYDLDFSGEEGGAANDVTAFYESIKDKITPTLGVERGFFASSAGATAKTDSAKNAAISGSVSYTDITADTRAWINPLTRLTLSGNLGVKADTNITVLNLAGALPVGSGGFATAGGDAAGIAVGYTGVNPTTIAGIGKGVVLERNAGSPAINVDVDAKSAVNLITLAPQGGKSTGKTGSGTFATNAVDGITRATISKDARLDLGTGKLGLDALTSLEIWAVGGSIAITKADGTGDSKTAGSVGVAGALNDVEFDTVARVGDAGADDASSASSAAAAANAGITAKDVAITAIDTGSINAISVAGTATSTTPAKPGAGSGTETDEKPKGVGSKIKGKLNYAAGLIQAPLFSVVGTYAEYAQSYASGVEKAEEAAQQDAVAKGTPVTKGFGIAGSASINLSDLTTRVETTNATFRRPANAAAANSSFTARAAEGVDMLSVTGGAAITTGSAKLPDGNTLISGAYGLSYSTNETASALAGTTIDGFGNVAVEAGANGSRIGAGMALSADTTKTAKGTTVAASVSHLVARDGAAATVTGGSITGGNAANGAVSILAYNGLTMGAGAGGLSWSSNNAAGGAVTVVDVGSPNGGAANARLVGTPVSGFADLSVRGLTAARIAGIAAAGAINVSGDSTKSALTVGMSINMISMDSTALIDTGATGLGRSASAEQSTSSPATWRRGRPRRSRRPARLLAPQAAACLAISTSAVPISPATIRSAPPTLRAARRSSPSQCRSPPRAERPSDSALPGTRSTTTAPRPSSADRPAPRHRRSPPAPSRSRRSTAPTSSPSPSGSADRQREWG
jgi:filamentous hemagglutinin family protein